MRVELSDRARLDLENIGEHYADVGGHALARRMVGGIKKKVLALAENPNIAPAYEMAPGLRRLVVAKGVFLAFYRVTNRVEVVHVRRAEREPYATPQGAKEPAAWN